MAIQTINIGNRVNDGLGDDLRTAFQKVNANFEELNSSLTVTASNTGTVGIGAGVFKIKSGNELQFRRLVSDNPQIELEELTDTILIKSKVDRAFTKIFTNSSPVDAVQYKEITVQGGRDIDVTALGSTITVNTILPVTKILTYYDFGTLDPEYTNSVQMILSSANIDFGTISFPSRFELDCGELS